MRVQELRPPALTPEQVEVRTFIAGRLEQVRHEFIAAREVARDSGEGELYVWLNAEIQQVDAMRSALAGEGS